jgi:hydroxyacylglutathione hydrolase
VVKQNSGINIKEIPEVTTVKMGFVDSYIIKGKADAKGENSWILVDCGISGSEGIILGTLKSLGGKPEKVSLIILTHAHRDHSGAVKELQRITGAKVAIQREDSEYLVKGISAKVTPVTGFAKFMARLIKSGPQNKKGGTTPDIIIENELDLNEFGVNGKVMSTPGHTKGSVSVFLNSGSCIVGDIFGKTLGKVASSMFCNDPEENRKSIGKITGSNATNLYLSHGGKCTINEVKKIFLP